MNAINLGKIAENNAVQLLILIGGGIVVLKAIDGFNLFGKALGGALGNAAGSTWQYFNPVVEAQIRIQRRYFNADGTLKPEAKGVITQFPNLYAKAFTNDKLRVEYEYLLDGNHVTDSMFE